MKSVKYWTACVALALLAGCAAGGTARVVAPPPAMVEPAPDPKTQAVIAEDSFRKAVALSRDARYAESAQWYERAATRNHPKAQFVLGSMYRSGKGVARDPAVAVQWYVRSATLGNALAQFSLGNMYIRGEGLPRNEAEGARLYRLAARQNLREAQYNLGALHYNGKGVARDYVEAERWFTRAARGGNMGAQFALGRLYSTPHDGVALDRVRGHAWYLVAAAGGHDKAAASAGKLGKIMSPAERAASRSLSRRLLDRENR